MSAKSAFGIALDAYKHHVRYELGYAAAEATLMLIGFTAGWDAHGDAVKQVIALADPSGLS